MALEIVPIACLTDNYAYLIKAEGACAVVDPSEAEPVEAALAERGWQLSHILNTHHHWDHTGGNAALKARFGARVVGPANDKARIPGLDEGVSEASGWSFAGYPVQILQVPAHTRSAVTYVIEANGFTGDTLFAMGCGRLFEGDAAMMWASLSKLMRLADDTLIWCGHEYTENNGRFALTLEPGNQALQSRMQQVRALRAGHKPTMPSRMGLEKQTNPFLRPDSAEIRKTLGMQSASDEQVFAEIRRRKDSF